MNYYERHIGDYLKDTAHLSLLEHGIYTRLLDVYYTKECGIEEGMAARIVGAKSKEELAALSMVLAEFFVLQAGIWTQSRCDKELDRFHDKQRKAKASADARWRHTERNANAMRTHTEGNALQTPVTSNQTPEEEKEKLPAPRQVAAPPPPPPFDGSNQSELNGKSVVTLAAHWELPLDWGEDAERLGFDVRDVLRESEKFRQYWVSGKGQGTRRAVKGWRQTWSNWLEKAAKEKR